MTVIGELVETDWQIERNGLLVGDNTDFDIRRIVGLASSATVRSQDRTVAQAHGAVPGSDYLSPRKIAMTFEIVSGGASDLSDRLLTLNTAFGPTNEEVPIVFQIPGVAGGSKARVEARVRRRDVPINMEFNHGVARVVFDIVATDPLIYSAAVRSETSSLSSGSSEGMEFDETPDISFGASSNGGRIQAYNAGNFETSPVLRISGPCTNPRVESYTQDRTMSFTMELGASEFLVIDTKQRSVLLGGTASRYSKLDSSSEWITLVPGSNDIKFSADTTTDATITTTWRDAWS